MLHINNIASLLKNYLQALPEPVMTVKARPHFLEALAMEDSPAKAARFGDLLLSLPPANRSTSLFLLAHMLRVRKGVWEEGEQKVGYSCCPPPR